MVDGYGKDLGVPLAPHDMRRTFAKLAHQGRAPLEQSQISLGYASIQTTERVQQNLTDAPCNHLGIRVQRKTAEDLHLVPLSQPRRRIRHYAPGTTGKPPRHPLVARREQKQVLTRQETGPQNIEEYHLRHGMTKLPECEYELTFSYGDDADLDDQVHDLLREISNEADLRTASSKPMCTRRERKDIGRAMSAAVKKLMKVVACLTACEELPTLWHGRNFRSTYFKGIDR